MPPSTPPYADSQPAIFPPRVIDSLAALLSHTGESVPLYQPLMQDPAGIWQLLNHTPHHCIPCSCSTRSLTQRINQLQQLAPTEHYRLLRQLLLSQHQHISQPKHRTIAAHWQRYGRLRSSFIHCRQQWPDLCDEETHLVLAIACLIDPEPATSATTNSESSPTVESYAQQLDRWAPDSLAGDRLRYLDCPVTELCALPQPIRASALFWRLARPNGESTDDLAPLASSLGITAEQLAPLQQQVDDAADAAVTQLANGLERCDFEALTQQLELLQQLPAPFSSDQRSPQESLAERIADQISSPFLLLEVQSSRLSAVAGRSPDGCPLTATLLDQLQYPIQSKGSRLARCVAELKVQLENSSDSNASELHLRRLLSLRQLLYIPVVSANVCKAVVVCPPATGVKTPLLHGQLLSRNLSLHLTEQERQQRRRLQIMSTHQSAVDSFADTLRQDLADPITIGHNYLQVLIRAQHADPTAKQALAAIGDALSQIEQRLQQHDRTGPEPPTAPELNTVINLILAEKTDSRSATPSGRIDFFPSSEPCLVEADPANLQQLIKALVNQFSNQTLQIETYHQVLGQSRPMVELSLRSTNPYPNTPTDSASGDAFLRQLAGRIEAEGGKLMWRTTASGDLQCTLLISRPIPGRRREV